MFPHEKPRHVLVDERMISPGSCGFSLYLHMPLQGLWVEGRGLDRERRMVKNALG